jgi:DNA-binding NarL/FixJ family response regulator
VSTITLFACETQPIVLAGLEKALERQDDIRLVGTSQNLTAAMPMLAALQPAVVLVDQTTGLKTTFQFIHEIRMVSPQSQVVLWIHDLAEMECFRALQLGVRGVLKKTLPLEAVVNCVRAVAGGELWMENSVSERVADILNRKSSPRLTPREREIVRLICRGLKNKEIAEALSITPGTVKVHLMHIFEKAGVKDRFELAMHGRRLMESDFGEDLVSMARAEGERTVMED